MAFKPTTFGPWVRGVDASTGELSQPKGSVPRGSNLLLTKRGSLQTCNGSAIIDAYNGVPTLGRGRDLCDFFFQPSGVASYFLRLMQALDQPLGPPANLTISSGGSGSSLAAGTYYYVVTAIDNVGGETTISNEVSITITSGLNITLVWNVVPNAVLYNVYRGASSGTEGLLVGTGLPVSQVAAGTDTVTFMDTGSGSTPSTLMVTSITCTTVVIISHVLPFHYLTTVMIVFPSSIVGLVRTGNILTYTPGTDSAFGSPVTWIVQNIVSNNVVSATHISVSSAPVSVGEASTGGTVAVTTTPPGLDTTQQTGLYAMPPAVDGISYSDANIVALFPAAKFGGQNSTPSGGILGNLSFIPQMVQFTNQAVLALGNGFAPQVYSDPNGTTTNPATTVAISAISVDAYGVVTITTAAPHNINPTFPAKGYPLWQPNTAYPSGSVVQPNPPNGCFYTAQNSGTSASRQPAWNTTPGSTTNEFNNQIAWQNTGIIDSTTSHQGVGANVVLAGISNSAYNTNGNGVSAFVTIDIPSTTSVKIVNRNAIGQSASSGGTLTVSTIPVVSTFTPQFPQWAASESFAINSVIVPTSIGWLYYYTAIQGGTSGGTQPTFPTTIGATVTDGGVIWQNSGTLVSAAPPPPGCGHVIIYSGSCWMFNTYIANTGPNTNTKNTATTAIALAANSGLDGPCSLRMSDVNNLQSWNPINQAFLDKDDGTDGMGLAAFTITAQGIPPEGSLVAEKLYATYQIVGVFGSSNFAIQRVQTDMGCTAPRSLQFAPGFGLTRQTHLGYAVFDGVTDRVISSQIQPYLFQENDPDVSDIVPLDPTWKSVAQGAQTANPPMYVSAIPIGMSNGSLTRILCFDLVLKAWDIVDLPFPISAMSQERSEGNPVITLLGSSSDGTLQRWQANDTTWATSAAGSGTPAPVVWLVRSPTVASKDAYVRLYARRVIIRGQQSTATMIINPRVGGVYQGVQIIALPASGDIQVQAALGITYDRFDADISGTGIITIDAIIWDVVGKPPGLLAGAVS